MPWTDVNLHIVWSTKNWYPFLDSLKLRRKLWKHMRENARLKGIYIDHIDGYTQHCHCLVNLKPDQSIAYVVQMIKGESSHWINENKLCKEKFEWQRQYWTESVSRSHVQRVRNYIRNQEEHHSSVTFETEFKDYLDSFRD